MYLLSKLTIGISRTIIDSNSSATVLYGYMDVSSLLGAFFRRRELHKRVEISKVLIVPIFLVLTSVVCADDASPVTPALTEVSPVLSASVSTQPGTVVTPDTEILKRSPKIDGYIEDGEWDTYYTYTSGDWNVATFVDWDSSHFYVGAESNKPIDLLAVLDANADGWFHGDENYEFKATRANDGSLNLVVCRYDSRNTKSPAATPVSAAEAAMVVMRNSVSPDRHVMELRIPASLIRSFKLTPERKIGFQVAVKLSAEESDWMPTNQAGEVKQCKLVTKKFATLKPLDIGFDLRDSVVTRGEDLVGRFHLTNAGTETIDTRYFVIAGEGKAGDYLSSYKVRIEPLPPKKHLAHDVRTLIPTDMPVGSWVMGAEVSSGDGRLGAALVSFDVVDPFNAELRLPAGDVRADVKDVTFGIAITNNCRRTLRGTAKISLPVGWELWRNMDSREFSVPGRSMTTVMFKAKPPLGELGNVPVKAEVISDREIKVLEGNITIVNP